MKLCECGCGQPTQPETQNRLGRKIGDFRRFKVGHNSRTRTSVGYPISGGEGSRYRIHRLRAEKALGKPLPPRAEVHHVDGTKRADAPLVICEDSAYHKLLHLRAKIIRLGGDPNIHRQCYTCKALKPIEAFGKRSRTSSGRDGTCLDCSHQRQRRSDAKRRQRMSV